jgi:hypothetical protein
MAESIGAPIRIKAIVIVCHPAPFGVAIQLPCALIEAKVNRLHASHAIHRGASFVRPPLLATCSGLCPRYASQHSEHVTLSVDV